MNHALDLVLIVLAAPGTLVIAGLVIARDPLIRAGLQGLNQADSASTQGRALRPPGGTSAVDSRL